jgi:2-keto-4-pentenoate hydratase/2-oxohepta-3-ene-1,7-dioic acid hydratase in catechol pathway
MQWLRAHRDGQAQWGRIEGDQVAWMSASPFGPSEPTGQRSALAEVQWLPPIEPGRQMLALWNNFAASAAKNGWARPTEPLWFIKSGNSHAGHGSDIPAPPEDTGRVAYEGELAIVIGSPARRLDVEAARQAIFGYSCANDVTAIELLHRDPSFAQWSRAKGFDGFGVLGPVIETDFDPAGAQVLTRVDGRERQNYPLSDMFFTPAEIVSALSQDITLAPGDVILCGTSLGVLPMKQGATVEVQIEGIGTLTSTYARAGR